MKKHVYKLSSRKKGKAAGKEPRRMYMQAFSPVKNPKRPRENQNIIFWGPKISFFVLDFSTYTKQVISFVGYRFETYWLNFQPKQENEPKKLIVKK